MSTLVNKIPFNITLLNLSDADLKQLQLKPIKVLDIYTWFQLPRA